MVIQLKKIIAEYNDLLSLSRHDDLSDLQDARIISLTTRARASIEKIHPSE